MSLEQAKALIERMKTDEAFREKVMAIEDAAGRIACIQNEGYECTEKEISDEVQVPPDAVGGGWGWGHGVCLRFGYDLSI